MYSNGCAAGGRTARTHETPIDSTIEGDLDLSGDVREDLLDEALKVDTALEARIADIEQFLSQFGDRLPERMARLNRMRERLG